MGNESHDFLTDPAQEPPQAGPSWARSNWPRVGGEAEDDLTRALDPTAMLAAVKQAAKQAGAPMDARAAEEAASDSIRAMMLVRTYRVRGHLAANLDPLGLTKEDIPADLTPEYHGFSGPDLDRKVYVGGTLGLEWTTVRELVDTLRANYCGPVGLEYMHISDVEEQIGRAHV